MFASAASARRSRSSARAARASEVLISTTSHDALGRPLAAVVRVRAGRGAAGAPCDVAARGDGDFHGRTAGRAVRRESTEAGVGELQNTMSGGFESTDTPTFTEESEKLAAGIDVMDGVMGSTGLDKLSDEECGRSDDPPSPALRGQPGHLRAGGGGDRGRRVGVPPAGVGDDRPRLRDEVAHTSTTSSKSPCARRDDLRGVLRRLHARLAPRLR